MHYNFSSEYTYPKCHNDYPITDETTGEVLCSYCGRVFAEKTIMIEESKLSKFEKQLLRSRTGSTTSLIMYDMGLQTIIANTTKDANGKSLSGKSKELFDRLRILEKRHKAYHIQRLQLTLLRLSALADKLAVPDSVAERAACICRKALDNQLTKGKSISCVACASLYTACRENNVPRTLDDIIEIANVSKKETKMAHKAIHEALELISRPHNLAEFTNRIGNLAGVSEKAKRSALFLLPKIEDIDFSGRNPIAVAASIIYFACKLNNESKTQKHIAKKASVSAQTLRSITDSLEKKFGTSLFEKH